MSNLNDIKFAAVAQKLLDKFGVNGSVIEKAEGVLDVETGDVVSLAITTDVRVSPPIAYKGIEVDETTVLTHDMKVYMDSSGSIDVKAGDEVIVSGLMSTIKGVDSIYSGDDAAIYVLHCAKGVRV